jgi:hypothetical protein
MAIKYEETQSVFGATIIKADLGNGHLLFIPTDPANSDYQRYLRWLEDPEAEENGTIS